MPAKAKPPNENREIEIAERYIRKNVKPLHDKGVINLDSPAREVINEITRQLKNPRTSSRKLAAPRTGGYILVGDKGWCDHRD